MYNYSFDSMEVPASRHKYSSLNAAEIRLFRLLPSSHSSTIVGRLSVERLSSLLRYDAISYVWGDLKQNIPITSGKDQNSQVTRNPEHALGYLHLSDRPRILWRSGTVTTC
jgi:hypothetical protein